MKGQQWYEGENSIHSVTENTKMCTKHGIKNYSCGESSVQTCCRQIFLFRQLRSTCATASMLPLLLSLSLTRLSHWSRMQCKILRRLPAFFHAPPTASFPPFLELLLLPYLSRTHSGTSGRKYDASAAGAAEDWPAWREKGALWIQQEADSDGGVEYGRGGGVRWQGHSPPGVLQRSFVKKVQDLQKVFFLAIPSFKHLYRLELDNKVSNA